MEAPFTMDELQGQLQHAVTRGSQIVASHVSQLLETVERTWEEHRQSDEAGAEPMRYKSALVNRLVDKDSQLIRLDITAGLFEELSPVEVKVFLDLFPQHPSIKSIHLSGTDLESVLTPQQIESMVLSIGSMDQIEDICVFRGGSTVINEELLARCLKLNKSAKVLLIWQFASLHEHPNLAGAMRQHPSLQRVTLTLPSPMPWSSLDIYAMAFCEMENLRVLQIRCQGKRQEDSIISPDAASALFSSKRIESLYLENIGLIDDHIDILAEELPNNKHLTLLDVKDNMFTDDVLYTIGRALPNFKKLTSLDLSGVPISQGGGEEIAKGMAQNTVMRHLELDGGEDRFKNEFDIPIGFSEEPWMKQVYYYLRLNRATKGGGSVQGNKERFVECLNSVSDQLDCLYHFVRTYPIHCDRQGKDTNTYFPRPVLMWHDEDAVRNAYCS